MAESSVSQALAEKELGMDLADVDPQAIAFIVERSKKAGNEAYQRRDYQEAIKLYSQAIAGDDKDKTLYSNRSAAYLSIGRYDDALVDAASCVRVDDAWAKGYFRLGNAYLAQQQWAEAAASFTRGIELAPDSKDMQVKLELAKEHRAEEEQAAQLQTKMQRRGIVLKLREARRSDNREIMLTQWRQSMTGPDWEAEDYEWRPTFLPGMRLRPIDKEVFESDPKRKMIVGYAAALAELDEPKRALGTLVDTARVNAFTEAVTRVVSEQRAALGVAPHAFCLSAGGGLLPLCIARAGARRVTAVEGSRHLYRMSKQVLEANRHAEYTSNINLVDRQLYGCTIRAPGSEAAEAGRATADEKEGGVVEELGDLLVLDTFTHTLLGKRALAQVAIPPSQPLHRMLSTAPRLHQRGAHFAALARYHQFRDGATRPRIARRLRSLQSRPRGAPKPPAGLWGAQPGARNECILTSGAGRAYLELALRSIAPGL
ncbi:hypothetical protein CYMTET_23179 [Cymbomonas tetramitiformis]|uniref:Uncharacterized protein n=1 Tax=Cymbomonas tetramitiformis TaxID=36881 RepID=A0AAE0L1D0_9CHLO|nr:hypothetical protein CYMTET_23179 [Cymbomonas tetramitiformis]